MGFNSAFKGLSTWPEYNVNRYTYATLIANRGDMTLNFRTCKDEMFYVMN
jgi:hypothetical protein